MTERKYLEELIKAGDKEAVLKYIDEESIELANLVFEFIKKEVRLGRNVEAYKVEIILRALQRLEFGFTDDGISYEEVDGDDEEE